MKGSLGSTSVTKISAILFLAVLVFCEIATAFGIKHRLADPNNVPNDLVYSIFWMHRQNDPTLFKKDILAEYSEQRAQPLPMLIYNVFGEFTGPVAICRYFPFGATFILVLLGFLIGHRIGGDWAGVMMAYVLFFASWHLGPGPGTAGDLAILFHAALTLALFTRNRLLAAVVILLAGVGYPPAALVAMGTGAVWLIYDQVKKQPRTFGHDALAITGITAFAYLLASVYFAETNMGALITAEAMEVMPEFHRGGVQPFFFESALRFLRSETVGIELTREMLVLFGVTGILLAATAGRAFRELPRIIWLWLGTSVTLYILAHLMLFHLLSPAKYLVPPLLILLCCLLVVSLEYIRHRPNRKIGVFAGYAFVIVALFQIGPVLQPENEIAPEVIETIEAVKTQLPKDALIAGHPYTMNYVPIFAKRSVLVAREMAEPYYEDYYTRMRRRITANLKAYYAKSPERVLEFCENFGVDYILVSPEDFTRDALEPDNIFYEPYGTMISDWIGDRKKFALNPPPDSWIVYQNESGYLIDPCKSSRRPLITSNQKNPAK